MTKHFDQAVVVLNIVDKSGVTAVAVVTRGDAAAMDKTDFGVLVEEWTLTPLPTEPGFWLWTGEILVSVGNPEEGEVDTTYNGTWRRLTDEEVLKVAHGGSLWDDVAPLH